MRPVRGRAGAGCACAVATAALVYGGAGGGGAGADGAGGTGANPELRFGWPGSGSHRTSNDQNRHLPTHTGAAPDSSAHFILGMIEEKMSSFRDSGSHEVVRYIQQRII